MGRFVAVFLTTPIEDDWLRCRGHHGDIWRISMLSIRRIICKDVELMESAPIIVSLLGKEKWDSRSWTAWEKGKWMTWNKYLL